MHTPTNSSSSILPIRLLGDEPTMPSHLLQSCTASAPSHASIAADSVEQAQPSTTATSATS
eukprot:scaffold126068_cov15-Tisochrysis_lutea.AAC.1